jgi:hypothetical protein
MKYLLAPIVASMETILTKKEFHQQSEQGSWRKATEITYDQIRGWIISKKGKSSC